MGNFVTVKVVREVTRKDFLGVPMKRFWKSVMIKGHELAVYRAPLKYRRLQDSLEPGAGMTKIDPNPTPTWAIVGASPKVGGKGSGRQSIKPVRYGRILEQSTKHHYRSGKSHLRGNPTKGWLSGIATLPAMRNGINDSLEDLADDLEQVFNGK